MKQFLFKHKISGDIKTYMDFHGADAAMQLIQEVNDEHIMYEVYS